MCGQLIQLLGRVTQKGGGHKRCAFDLGGMINCFHHVRLKRSISIGFSMTIRYANQ